MRALLPTYHVSALATTDYLGKEITTSVGVYWAVGKYNKRSRSYRSGFDFSGFIVEREVVHERGNMFSGA